MSRPTLQQVKALAEQLTPTDQFKLVEHLVRQLRVDGSPRPTRSLRGVFVNHAPDDDDTDSILHEIRHEWEKEWTEDGQFRLDH